MKSLYVICLLSGALFFFLLSCTIWWLLGAAIISTIFLLYAIYLARTGKVRSKPVVESFLEEHHP